MDKKLILVEILLIIMGLNLSLGAFFFAQYQVDLNDLTDIKTKISINFHLVTLDLLVFNDTEQAYQDLPNITNLEKEIERKKENMEKNLKISYSFFLIGMVMGFLSILILLIKLNEKK